MSGFLGQSPDFWQNLASFGGALGAAANQRTAGGFLANGTGLAGPLGVGAGNFVQAERQGEALRSQMALQAANTQGVLANNQLTQLQIPFMKARLQYMQNYMGMPAPGASQPPDTGTPFGGVAQPSGSNADIIPPEQRPVLINYAVHGTPIPPNLLNAVVSQESGWNTNATSKTGAIGLGQILPSTAKDPGFGMPGVDPSYITGSENAPNNLKIAAQYLYARGKAAGVTNWNDPAQQAIALAAYHSDVDNPRYVKQVQARMQAPMGAAAPQQGAPPSPGAPMPAAAQPMQQQPQGQAARYVPQGMPTPQEAMQQANQADVMAHRAAMANFDQDAINWRNRAQQYREYAFGALKNFTMRPGGVGYSPAFGPIKNPQEVGIMGPNGQETYGYSTPPFHIPGLPAEPGGITPAMIAPQPGAPQGASQPGIPSAPGAPVPAGGQSAGLPTPGAPAVKEISPESREFYTERGKGLGEQFQQIDEDATSAVSSNFLFDNLRNDSKSWQMGQFANVAGEARAWLSAAAHAAGIASPNIDKKLADYQAFNKSSGMLLRTAVHDVSSRAAVQEYKLISDTLPQPTTSEQGFGQIADQWQGLNDYRIAKQKFARSYEGDPKDFNVTFNSHVTPVPFMLHRMSQTASGQADLSALIARLQSTSAGKLQISRMMNEYGYAQKAGLFDDLPPIGGAQ